MLRLKYVQKNSVLGRCVCVVSNHIATSPLFLNLAYINGKFGLHDLRFKGGYIYTALVNK